MASVYDVAIYFLSKSPMTQKKLQKLVYYAYAWTLTLLNDDEKSLDNRLFDEDIQAWVHGPVCPPLYSEYKHYGWQDIPMTTCKSDIFNEDVLEILDQVWDVYGGFSGNELENISHQEEPWQNSRKGYTSNSPSSERIDDKIIYQYYNSRLGN